jgi:DNA-binding PadR family transcriptional regulator
MSFPKSPNPGSSPVGRNDLREQGLIRDDTPRSTWEITEKGRQWLRQHS